VTHVIHDDVKGPFPTVESVGGINALKEIWPGLSSPVGYNRILKVDGSWVCARVIIDSIMLVPLLTQLVTSKPGPSSVVIAIEEFMPFDAA
jgi:hypothetical protein